MTIAYRLELTCGAYGLVVADEPWGVEPVGYSVEYHLEEERNRRSSLHGVTVSENGEDLRTCLLIGGGGASGVHAHSAVCVGERCYVAVGDSMCALSIPALELAWHSRVDAATCFGVYYSQDCDCLISHGELEIARLDLNGRVVWTTSGRDIFSEGFQLDGKFAEATDFYKTIYRIDLETGRVVAESSPSTGA